MPQLKSGRQFALSLSPYISSLRWGSDGRPFDFLFGVRTPRDLLQMATIGYFDPNGSGPPAGDTYSSGYSVRDLVMGNTDWFPEEIDEFIQWATTNSALDPWLSEQLAEAKAVVENSPALVKLRAEILGDD